MPRQASGSAKKRSGLSGVEKAIIFWLIFSGSVHIFIEGTWALIIGPEPVKKADPTLNFWLTPFTHYVPKEFHSPQQFLYDCWHNFWTLGWREYAKGDSRYTEKYDPFVISMEIVTAVFDGPLCYLAAYAILKRLPWRYAAVMIVSCAQLYGDVLYFMTEHYEDYSHVDWSHWLYYFVYFSMFNIVWIIIPTSLIVWSWVKTSQAVSSSDKLKAA